MALSNVYGYRFPSGVPGAVTRETAHTGEPNVIDTNNPPLAHGDPVKMVGGKIQALAAGDTTSLIYGFIERSFPGFPASGYPTTGLSFGVTAPVPGGMCTIMKRGYMSVALQGATAATKAGPVYVRVAGTVPANGRLSGLEAAADGTASNTPQVPNAYFMGAADANGNVEIAFNL